MEWFHILKAHEKKGVSLSMRRILVVLIALATLPPWFLPALGVQEETASSVKPVIKTSEGEIVISEVEISDRLPPGCEDPKPQNEDIRRKPAHRCTAAPEGCQFVVLWLEPTEEGQNWRELQHSLPMEAMYKAKLVAPDHIGRFASGGMHGRLYVAFWARGSGKDYELVWGDNPRIKLEIK